MIDFKSTLLPIMIVVVPLILLGTAHFLRKSLYLCKSSPRKAE